MKQPHWVGLASVVVILAAVAAYAQVKYAPAMVSNGRSESSVSTATPQLTLAPETTVSAEMSNLPEESQSSSGAADATESPETEALACDASGIPTEWQQRGFSMGGYEFSVCFPANWIGTHKTLAIAGYEQSPQSLLLQSDQPMYRENKMGEAEIGIWVTERKTGSENLSPTVSTGSALLEEMLEDGRAVKLPDGIITAQPPLNIDFYNAVPKDTINTLAGIEAKVMRGRINGSRWKGNDAANPIDRETQVAIINIEGEYQLEIYDDGQLHLHDNIFDTIVKSFKRTK